MIVAIYARKSTEQAGTADEQKSVTRQIDAARQYAARKGWTVAEEHVYSDDGISGAEFNKRPGFLRLMNALKPHAPFQVLVMMEESRLGRESIETAYALKQLVQAGVRVFFYMEDRERTLDTPTEKFMMSLTTFTDELERDKARQRGTDTMIRKARTGHVCGGRVFGYDNITVTGANGKRSHVELRINEGEQAVVLRIFALSAQGKGQTSIAKTLNSEAAVSPRAQQGRPSGWAPSSVREVLHRTLYRGEKIWNRTKKRDRWGQVHPTARDASEWIRFPAPHLRIVPDELWKQVHERLGQQRDDYLRGTKGQLWGRPAHGVESKYLLSGFARCADCNGSMYVKSRQHGKRRAFFYGCTSFHLRGKAVCSNSLEVPMPASDTAVLTAIEADILRPEVITATVRKALAKLRPSAEAAQARRADIDKRLAAVGRELDRLTAAIVATGPVPTLLEAVKDREGQREALARELGALEQAGRQIDWTKIERDLEAKLADWKGLLQRQVPQARQVLKKLLTGPIVFKAVRENGERHYAFTARMSLGGLLKGTASAMSFLGHR